MKQVNTIEDKQLLQDLCSKVRELIDKNDHEQCEKLVKEAMYEHPHASEPHNLIGILLEKEGDHVGAMKHFRAALSLNPTYIPARHNLELFGTFLSKGRCAFDEMDCPKIERKNHYEVIHDEYGMGRIIRRDENGR